VKASVTAAFTEFEKLFGITIPESDRQMAQQLLPKASTPFLIYTVCFLIDL